MTEYGNGEAFDTEQFRNVQESERYGIHFSGTKKIQTEVGYSQPTKSLWRAMPKKQPTAKANCQPQAKSKRQPQVKSKRLIASHKQRAKG